MEEQEKIDMREHLINWIDTFLKDGIIPKVVNPNAIKANYIPKQVIRDKIKELEEVIKITTEKLEWEENTDVRIRYRTTIEQATAQILVLKEIIGE